MAVRTDTYTGPNGIPSRLTELTGSDAERALKDLKARGCGAWVGRSACNAPVSGAVTLGETRLLFTTYRNLIVPHGGGGGHVIAVFCADHEANWLKDMPQALRRSQEKERQKYLRLNSAELRRMGQDPETM